jgi:hypothetical protein
MRRGRTPKSRTPQAFPSPGGGSAVKKCRPGAAADPAPADDGRTPRGPASL